MKAFRTDRRPEEQKIAEKILGAAVIGATLTVSPIAGAAIYFLGAGTLHYMFRKSDFNREVKRLQKNGYVALTKTEKGWLVKILQKGKERFRQTQVMNLQLPKPGQWDGQWRLFIFDIPEDQRYARDAMRRKLKGLGIYNIQRSVLAYPYDCRKELQMVADYYRLGKYATYLETNNIDIDKELRKHFKI